jgi:proton-translocating NADH-quinone oxidoreductase chain N
MQSEAILASVVAVPLLGSFLLPVLGRVNERIRNAAALIFLLISTGGAALLLPDAMAGKSVDVVVAGVNLFHLDRLAVFMALVSSLVGAIIILYSFDYISHYGNRNEYYFMVVLFLGSMMGLVFSRNLLALYLFWEITALACWRLIGFFREKVHVLRADKAFLVTVFGALCMLIGFVMIYAQTGSFDLGKIQAALTGKTVSDLAVLLILCGILSKSATVPLHTWLPDAGVAPSPVTALLHAAVLVKIGVYVYARLFLATFQVGDIWHTVVPVVAGVSALVSAGAALVETDLKRLIAYSTVSQIGFIFLGLSIGNGTGVAGGLLYILMHGLAKGGLFLCAGIVEQNAHTKDLRKMGGLGSTMPMTALAFLACAFSVMGIPPFGGFFSKYLVMAGAFDSGQLAIAFTFLGGAVLTIIYLLRAFVLVFCGTRPADLADVREKSPVMVFSVSLLAVLSLGAGLLFQYPAEFARAAVQQMLGVAP